MHKSQKLSRRSYLLLLAMFLAISVVAQQSQQGAPAPTHQWVLRLDGIGPVKIGTTLSQLKSILHNDVKEEPSGNESCFYITSAKHPHVGFMMIHNRVVRIDITQRGIPTSEGIQVGDSESTAKAAYPRLTVQPRAYNAPDGSYHLTIQSSDGRLALRFETYKGKITGFYSGTSEAIQYIEGCD